MIIPTKKFLFLGTQLDLNMFFDNAQKKGIIQFIPSIAKELEQPREIQDFLEALKVLKHYRYEESVYPESVLPSEVVIQVLALQNDFLKLGEAKLKLHAEILKIQPLGDFSLEEIKEIESASECKFYFYYSKRGIQVDDPDLVLINTDHEFDFYMSFTKTPIESADLTPIVVNESLSSLKAQLNEVKEKIKEIEARLKKLAPFSDFLKEHLLEKINRHDLISAKERVAHQLDGKLFAVEAWVPENKISQLVHLTVDLSIHFEEIQIEESDRVPTCMENHGAGKIGEDLVHIYDVPAHTDKDPSRWVLIFFALFFAMIISDAGYGLIYLAFGLFMYFKNPMASPLLKRTIKLINLVSVFSVVWGVMACSYFSIPINPDSTLSKISGIQYLVKKKAQYHMAQKDEVFDKWTLEFPQIKNAMTSEQFVYQAVEKKGDSNSYLMQEEFTDNILLEISLIIGILHISLSFLRNIRVAHAGIGWILTMIGGYLYFPIFLKSTSIVHFMNLISKQMAHTVGAQLLIGGAVLALVLSLIQNKLKGFAEILTSIQVFADVLSYIRLYALGLAGMIMASTFNEIGHDIGFVLGAAVTVCGHVVNITLGIMGGVIHGLRLNFLEWYHYSFSGGGRLFSPLRLLKEKLN